MKRSRWGLLSVLLIFLSQQSSPLYAWPYACKSIGDVYVSRDLYREPLPVLKVHSRVQMDGFTRFYVSSQYAYLPWRYAYIDYYPPQGTIIRVQFDNTQVKGVVRVGGFPGLSPLMPTGFTPLVDKKLEALVGTLLQGSERQIKRVVQNFLTQTDWKKHLGQKYWVRDYLEFEVKLGESGVEFVLKPSVGQFVVHRSSLNPVTVDPWRIPDANMALEEGLRPLWSMLGVQNIEQEPPQHVYWRVLKHPNRFLAFARQLGDGAIFHFFLPYVLVANLIQGNSPLKYYRPVRGVVMGWWLIILLAELLFYTPISYTFSDEETPENTWSRLWFGDDLITDLYAVRAQWGFEKEGVTVLWNGLVGDTFYERWGSWGDREISAWRYRAWNAVVVSYGEPTSDEVETFDHLVIRSGQDTPLADIYVHQQQSLIYYHFATGALRLPHGGLATVFKGILQLVRSIGCSGQPESCGIKNVVVDSHGGPGVLENVLDFFMLSETTEIRWSCETAACRGLPEPAQQTLAQQDVAGWVMEKSQFVFVSCGVAQGDRGEQAVKLFADYFKLSEKKGRVVAARKPVVPILSLLPLQAPPSQSPAAPPSPPVRRKAEYTLNPYTWIRKGLAYKIGKEAQKYNHWDAIDLVKGSFLFGPFSVYRAGKKFLAGGSWSCSEDCVMDLDYRESEDQKSE